MAEGWTTESVLKKHGLWRELAGPAAAPTAIKLQWQDMQLEKIRSENQWLRTVLSNCRNLGKRMAESKGDEYDAALKALVDTLDHWDVDRVLSSEPPADQLSTNSEDTAHQH